MKKIKKAAEALLDKIRVSLVENEISSVLLNQ
jgi:hypothetical protein